MGLYNIVDLAVVAGCKLLGDDTRRIGGIATLRNATDTDISFLHNNLYMEDFQNTKAAACIVKEEHVAVAPNGVTLLVTDDPYTALCAILDNMHPSCKVVEYVAESAYIGKSTVIGKGCYIGHGAVISDDVRIEDGCYIEAGAYIGSGVYIGSNTFIGHSCTLLFCRIGASCILHAGVRIGQDGFGFAISKKGIKKVKQIGYVVIGDDVEIGANTCIDRGSIEDTVIGSGTKIDNLVQIAHNVVVGRNCVIVGQTGIGGSTVLEDNVVIGGQVGIAGHLKIGSGSMVAAQSGVICNVPPQSKLGGTPAVNIQQWHRQTVYLKKMVRGDTAFGKKAKNI